LPADHPPEAVEKVNPKCSDEARRAKSTGFVTLRSTISDTGVVEDIEALESLDESLTTAAVEAAEQWRFKTACVTANRSACTPSTSGSNSP